MKVICEYKDKCSYENYCKHRKPHNENMCRCSSISCSHIPGKLVYCIDVNETSKFKNDIDRILDI